MGINLSDRDAILIIVSFFLPPVGVFIKRGLRADFWINLGLTLLGYIPGMIHAWYIIIEHRDYL
ncbi:UPF0057-domain-containing protein [Neoconidiobolus thromboides FSU 785]|nr:UPF0057-domain-containing protein [Neoconidiobolus thromboides FSU 785]